MKGVLEHHCVLFNQTSLRGAWGVAPYFPFVMHKLKINVEMDLPETAQIFLCKEFYVANMSLIAMFILQLQFIGL